ncbi:nuclear transport factor 2 family protein [uncultured Caballeronia sp.]|uniref:nuclear transport factor 2 family protein n=1 Tax=uncultured Caballeronia sp. TaxID=1827198 RepID=UPI0035C972B2
MTDHATKEADALAVVKTFYQGAADGRIVEFEQYLAENFRLFVPDYLPWGGQYDKAGYVSILPRVAATLDFLKLSYESLTVQGEHVVALIRIAVQGTDKSILISEHWDIAEGKAQRLLVAYFDPKVLLDKAA